MSNVRFLNDNFIVWQYGRMEYPNLYYMQFGLWYNNKKNKNNDKLVLIKQDLIENTHKIHQISYFTWHKQLNMLVSGTRNGLCVYDIQNI